jgi:hypothetical protein
VDQQSRPSRAAASAALLVSVLVVAPVAAVSGRARVPERSLRPATREVVAGPRYAVGPFGRLLLGNDFRDLWTTPIGVEVLDMQASAGGLTSVRRVGGQQSKALALVGADGRDYTFRNVDRDPSAMLPEDLRGTIDRGAREAARYPGILGSAFLDVIRRSPVILPDVAALLTPSGTTASQRGAR